MEGFEAFQALLCSAPLGCLRVEACEGSFEGPTAARLYGNEYALKRRFPDSDGGLPIERQTAG
jgi:hypothetical protein